MLRVLLRGGCHCGAVRFELQAAAPPAQCRICSCDYCRKAGPRWWSDPSGLLELSDPHASLSAYRFGTRTADFLFCSRCGSLLAARCEIEGKGYAVLNLGNAEGIDAAALPATAFSFDAEDLATRLARRARNWTPLRTGTSASSSPA